MNKSIFNIINIVEHIKLFVLFETGKKKMKDPLLKRGKIKVPLCHYIISNACTY